MEPDDVHRPILAEILRQIMRLDVTIKDLLIYARPNAPRFEKCELGKVIERALTVLEQEPHLQGIAVQARIAPTLPLVMADERQIEQVMLNLLLNAAHASTAGNRIEVLSRSNNNEVKLLVRDHGQGMTPDVAGRAFEPFFTNKAKGTGLGLPICKRIIEDHGGRITIDSSPGAGTTVTVMLPLRQEAELTRAEACP
jgi:signal transduction histidine kinase